MYVITSKYKVQIRKAGPLLAGIIHLILLQPEAMADLNSSLYDIYGSMSQTTHPDTYTTERRGVISGGSFRMRSGVDVINPVSLTLPNAGAGCSGIDLYGGSFSYINKDEFVSFLRTIAANAQGYAFQIALSSICEKCAQEMESLQRKVQQLNEYFGNSCQLAQGVVNDTLGSFGRKGLNDASLIGQFQGMGDLFEMNSAADSAEIYSKATEGDAEAVKHVTGNVMWQSLMQNGIFADDPDLAEAVMSLTGTMIVSEDGQEAVAVPYGLLSLEDLIQGGTVSMYSCDNTAQDACLTVRKTSHDLKGLGQLIQTALNGEDGESGIVQKFNTGEGAFTETEKNILNAMPAGMTAMIRNLAVRNAGAARSFVQESSGYIALSAAAELTDNYLSSAVAGVKVSNHAYAELMLNNLADAKSKIYSDRSALTVKYGSLRNMRELYRLTLDEISAADYTGGREYFSGSAAVNAGENSSN